MMKSCWAPGGKGKTDPSPRGRGARDGEVYVAPQRLPLRPFPIEESTVFGVLRSQFASRTQGTPTEPQRRENIPDNPHQATANNDNTFNVNGMRLRDIIATLFHHVEPKHPGVLRGIFDLNYDKGFKFTGTLREPGKRAINLIISRVDDNVFTGVHTDENDRLAFLGPTWSVISRDNALKPVWAAEQASSPLLIKALERSGFNFDRVNAHDPANYDPLDEDEMAKVMTSLVRHMWNSKIWQAGDDLRFFVDIVER
ncbi:hypothetical protein K458DRAFT_386077 [Lentithecium fluviatile CBS 122367]|uniref:Uncharacterized protein n=1 Tax=Lentithecium fluviatile CBS 122367 TaxID=1168545 RepID=A0A6G1JAJ4_9PLEO|nr:hypothetical protein K458DRAFT_386077 [Lentithecium fluviatile CBS 122367]